MGHVDYPDRVLAFEHLANFGRDDLGLGQFTRQIVFGELKRVLHTLFQRDLQTRVNLTGKFAGIWYIV